MEFVKDHERAGNSRGVDVVQSVGKAVRLIKETAQELVVCRDDNSTTVEEAVVGLFAGLQRDERRHRLMPVCIRLRLDRETQPPCRSLSLTVDALSQRP